MEPMPVGSKCGPGSPKSFSEGRIRKRRALLEARVAEEVILSLGSQQEGNKWIINEWHHPGGGNQAGNTKDVDHRG